MNKPIKTFFIILVILSLIPGYLLFKWVFQPKKELNILILDKTVPSFLRENHRSFNWILTHEKYVKPDKKRYNYTKDYFGFFPLKPQRSKQYEIKRIRLSKVIELADSFDMAYYDILAYPTDLLERTKTEELFDLKWTEWLGKYFSSLDSIKNPDLPKWIMDIYRDQYHKPWTFKHGGIVFVSFNNRVVVLEDKKDLDFGVPYIYTTDYGQKKFGLPYKVVFPSWFEVVDPGNNKVVSSFKIHVNNLGDSILTSNSIPNQFPAVLESSTEYPHFYFAGNFSNNPIYLRTAYFPGYEKFCQKIGVPFLKKKSYFYWHFYQPLMTHILDQYYTERKGMK